MTSAAAPNDFNELWSFATERFAVTFHALQENMDPSDSFEFDDDIAFARQGGAAWFCAAVIVTDTMTGETLGSDYLGGCSYRSFREFYSAHWRDPAEGRNTLAMKARNTAVCHYFPDMVRTAIGEARITLRNQATRAARMRCEA